jgi:hypothetical protein
MSDGVYPKLSQGMRAPVSFEMWYFRYAPLLEVKEGGGAGGDAVWTALQFSQ